MDAERFARGITYDAYKKAMTDSRGRLDAWEKGTTIDPATLAYFNALKPVHVVAIVTDRSGDVATNLPIMGVLAREAGTLDVRIFRHDENEDLMNRWLNRGVFQSVPVFAFFDESFRELGVFIERPASVTDSRVDERPTVFAANPDLGSPDVPVEQLSPELRAKIQVALNKSRDAAMLFTVREVLFAIRDCIARAPAR